MNKAPSGGAPNFDPLARIYRWLELLTFGPFLQRCRTFFLPQTAAARSALIFGDGDGRFTAALLRANPNVTVDAVDASAAMLHALRLRAGAHASRVHASHADARLWQPERSRYDLIATHFFFDCLSTGETATLAANVRTAANPNALWLVSEFHVPATRFGRFVAAPLVALLYRAFAVLTGLQQRQLPAYHAALQAQGFRLAARHELLRGLLAAELWRAAGAAPRTEQLP